MSGYSACMFKGWMFNFLGIKAEQVKTSLLKAKVLSSTHSSSVADSSSPPSASPSCPLETEVSDESDDAVVQGELPRPAGMA